VHSTFKPWTQIQTDFSEANQPPEYNPPPVQQLQPTPQSQSLSPSDLAYLEAQQRISMAEWEASRYVAPVIGAGVMGPEPIQDISISSHTQPSHFAPTKITPPAHPVAASTAEEAQAIILELKRQNHELRQDNTTLARQVKALLDEKAHLQSELNWGEHDRKRFKLLMGNLFIKL